MSDRIYCYQNSDVLINKMGIRDMEQLRQMEKRLTMLRILELVDSPIQGKFGLKHLQLIHKYIFQDVYEWAGKIRKVNIAKGNMFCSVKFIESQAEEIFGKLREENYLSGLSEEEFPVRLAYYFSEINALHPFREGNGRSQREFIRTLSLYNEYVINFAKVSRKEMLKASESSFLCKYEEMEKLFSRCLKKKNETSL